MAVDAFIQAFDNEYLETNVLNKDPKDLESALQAAFLIESRSVFRNRNRCE